MLFAFDAKVALGPLDLYWLGSSNLPTRWKQCDVEPQINEGLQAGEKEKKNPLSKENPMMQLRRHTAHNWIERPSFELTWIYSFF